MILSKLLIEKLNSAINYILKTKKYIFNIFKAKNSPKTRINILDFLEKINFPKVF